MKPIRLDGVRKQAFLLTKHASIRPCPKLSTTKPLEHPKKKTQLQNVSISSVGPV